MDAHPSESNVSDGVFGGTRLDDDEIGVTTGAQVLEALLLEVAGFDALMLLAGSTSNH
jgi:hypothetical protein